MPPEGSFDAIVEYYNASLSKGCVDVVPQLQSELTKLHNRKKVEYLKGTYGREMHARMTACAAEKATQWMIPSPVGERILGDEACRTANRIRLGLPLINKSHNV